MPSKHFICSRCWVASKKFENSERCRRRSYQQFQGTWSQTQEDAQASALTSTTLVFERIWTNKQLADSRRKAVSIWRPVPPQGYVAVGDCLVVGSWTAPRSAAVLNADLGERSIAKSALVRACSSRLKPARNMPVPVA